MLTHIDINNYLLVEHAAMSFTHGFTALTGETGAGKSILLGAISLALGGRLSTPVVRDPAHKCVITLTFTVDPQTPAHAWLSEQLMDQDDNCTIQRIITHDGKSRATVNGFPCALTLVRALGEMLLQIHGQHDNQHLLNSTHQRSVLDTYGQHTATLQSVAAAYNEVLSINKEIARLKDAQQTDQAQLSLWQYQCDELDQAQLVEQEFDQLMQQQKCLDNQAEIDYYKQAIEAKLDGDQTGALLSATQRLAADTEALAKLDAQYQALVALVQTAAIHLEEAASSFHQLAANTEETMDAKDITSRIELLNTLARKHKVDPNQLIAVRDNLCANCDALANIDMALAAQEAALKTARAKYDKVAKQLTQQREQSAKALSKAITENMQSLAMTGGHFTVELTKTDAPSQYGSEQVVFMVMTNPGQATLPLAKIASGGEVSRISLALKAVTLTADANHTNTPCMIFDEVDTGIGGQTAIQVGQCLKTLATQAQLICITHLPQIAAVANQQYRIEKRSTNNDTTTTLSQLNDEERLYELARMLGGDKDATDALAHAKTLIDG